MQVYRLGSDCSDVKQSMTVSETFDLQSPQSQIRQVSVTLLGLDCTAKESVTLRMKQTDEQVSFHLTTRMAR